MPHKPSGRPGSTPAQLRADIDAGKTGDKVAWPDPAAAPLGTDEEAADTPLSPQAVALARAQEEARPARPRRDFGLVIWVLAFLVIAALLISAAVLVRG